MPEEPANPASRPRQTLSLLDAASIMVGIVIGSAIFQIAPDVAGGAVKAVLGAIAWRSGEVSQLGPASAEVAALCIAAIVGIWLLGAAIALIGAMCYAELATAYPAVGGTYVYLSEALGRSSGFAFAWAEFWVVRPGNVGAVAYVLATYARPLLPRGLGDAPPAGVLLASTAIIVLAVLNALGLRVGKRTQNLLTAAKILGLLAIIVVGLTVRAPQQVALHSELVTGSLSLALIQIMFAYGGWADISFVAAEVRHPERNIFRALLLGTGTVAALYVLANLAFINALGLTGVVNSEAVAVDVVSLRFDSQGPYDSTGTEDALDSQPDEDQPETSSRATFGSRAISLLVVVSCLGAINGMLLTGSRVFYALGTHHPTFQWLGAWNAATGVPLRSLVLQTLVTLGLVIACGGNQGFQRLVVVTAPFYWGFIALVGVALLILRRRGRTLEATYRVPLSPLTPLIFVATSGAMVYAGIDFAVKNWAAEAWWAIAVIASGLLVGMIDWRSRHARSRESVSDAGLQ